NIFFPGGTRSRSGATEPKVKLGLIGSLIEAQRLNIERGKNDKIFVVTMNINYHFVLEAGMLIDQYLRQLGRERHAGQNRQSMGILTYFRYLVRLMKNQSEVHISLGKVMDVFGNTVDEKGNSIDKFGNNVQLVDYFSTEGKITSDAQRESIYTRLLGDSVVKEYAKIQVVLTSTVVAFVAFHILYKDHDNLDVVSFVNMKPSALKISKDQFSEKCQELIDILKVWASEDKILLSDELLNEDIDLIIKNG